MIAENPLTDTDVMWQAAGAEILAADTVRATRKYSGGAASIDITQGR